MSNSVPSATGLSGVREKLHLRSFGHNPNKSESEREVAQSVRLFATPWAIAH